MSAPGSPGKLEEELTSGSEPGAQLVEHSEYGFLPKALPFAAGLVLLFDLPDVPPRVMVLAIAVSFLVCLVGLASIRHVRVVVSLARRTVVISQRWAWIFVRRQLVPLDDVEACDLIYMRLGRGYGATVRLLRRSEGPATVIASPSFAGKASLVDQLNAALARAGAKGTGTGVLPLEPLSAEEISSREDPIVLRRYYRGYTAVPLALMVILHSIQLVVRQLTGYQGQSLLDIDLLLLSVAMLTLLQWQQFRICLSARERRVVVVRRRALFFVRTFDCHLEDVTEAVVVSLRTTKNTPVFRAELQRKDADAIVFDRFYSPVAAERRQFVTQLNAALLSTRARATSHQSASEARATP